MGHVRGPKPAGAIASLRDFVIFDQRNCLQKIDTLRSDYQSRRSNRCEYILLIKRILNRRAIKENKKVLYADHVQRD